MAAEADSVVSYGESLWSPAAAGEVHERVENSLRRGITAYYRLGQLLPSRRSLTAPASRRRGHRTAAPAARPARI